VGGDSELEVLAIFGIVGVFVVGGGVVVVSRWLMAGRVGYGAAELKVK